MRRILTMALVCAGMLAGADDSCYEVRVGALYRAGMKMKASGGTYATASDRIGAVQASLDPARSWTVIAGSTPQQAVIPSPADDTLGVGNREFDDGFNRESPPTTATVERLTWYWGYNSAGQYDAGAQQIVFHRTTSGSAQGSYQNYRVDDFSVTEALFEHGEASGEESFEAIGAQAEICFPVSRRERLTIGVVGGVSLAWSDQQDTSFSVSTAVREDRHSSRTDLAGGYDWTLDRTFSETYRYNEPYGVTNVAIAPYAGTYEGPGPMLANTPTSRVVTSSDALVTTPHGSQTSGRVVSSGEWQGVSRVEFSADMLRATLQGGPELEWAATKKITVSLAPKLTLNLLDISATRKETLEAVSPSGARAVAKTWRDEKDEQQWVPGASLSFGLAYAMNAQWGLRMALGCEWAFERPSVEVGPGRLTFDLDSMNVEAAAVRAF